MTEGKMDIVERLLELAPYVEQQPPVEYEVAASNAMRDAAAEITRLRAEVERLQDHIENVAKDTQRLLMERDAENERLRAAAQEGRTDLLIAANNARDAAKTDPRWQGVAEKLMARVAMIDAVLEAQEPAP